MTVITIEGPAGSRKKTIGSIVAGKLNLDYVDRLVLSDVAKNIGATVEAITEGEKSVLDLGERLTRALLRILDKSTITSASGDPYFGPSAAAFLPDLYDYQTDSVITDPAYLNDDTYIDALTDVLTEYVKRGNVVIMGRGSNWILRDKKEVFRVGVIANMDRRINFVVKEKGINVEEAKEQLVVADKARIGRYKRMFDIDICDDPVNYDLVVNSGSMNIDTCVNVVINAVKDFTAVRSEQEIG